MSQQGNSVSQNGMCNAGENMLLVMQEIQPEMHLQGPNRGMLMLLTKCSTVGAGKSITPFNRRCKEIFNAVLKMVTFRVTDIDTSEFTLSMDSLISTCYSD
jgi:hypothetical protein